MEPQTDQKQARRRTFPRNSQGIKLHIINSSFSSKESWGIPQPLLVGWKNNIIWRNFCVYSKSCYVGLSFSISGGWWDFFWAKLITGSPKRQKPPRRSAQWWESSSSAGCLSLSQTWLQVKPTLYTYLITKLMKRKTEATFFSIFYPPQVCNNGPGTLCISKINFVLGSGALCCVTDH